MCPSFTLEEAHNLIPWQEKLDFYSAAAKVACRVGGPSPEGSTDVERKPETMEPANYHGYCAAFWESLLDCHSIILTSPQAVGTCPRLA
jgi:hypothetical protein